MAIDALVKPFLLLPLFQGLKPLQLTEIVRRADRIIYRPGDSSSKKIMSATPRSSSYLATLCGLPVCNREMPPTDHRRLYDWRNGDVG
jgi:hypothetical protein